MLVVRLKWTWKACSRSFPCIRVSTWPGCIGPLCQHLWRTKGMLHRAWCLMGLVCGCPQHGSLNQPTTKKYLMSLILVNGVSVSRLSAAKLLDFSPRPNILFQPWAFMDYGNTCLCSCVRGWLLIPLMRHRWVNMDIDLTSGCRKAVCDWVSRNSRWYCVEPFSNNADLEKC